MGYESVIRILNSRGTNNKQTELCLLFFNHHPVWPIRTDERESTLPKRDRRPYISGLVPLKEIHERSFGKIKQAYAA